MQMSGYIFITRHWQEDKDRMTRSLDYLVSQQRRSQILIFPEGTDLNDKSKANSDSYAEKNGLKKYEYTLHPRTTGFSFVTNHLQQANFLDAIYDMTIGYPYEVPQKELDISKGIFPKEVHINIKRVPASELPCDEQGLRSWIEDRWRSKEKMLQQFYQSKKFADQSWPRPKQLPLYVAALFWLSLTGENQSALFEFLCNKMLCISELTRKCNVIEVYKWVCKTTRTKWINFPIFKIWCDHSFCFLTNWVKHLWLFVQIWSSWKGQVDQIRPVCCWWEKSENQYL